MTYKQFIQELEDDVLPSEAEHRCAFFVHLNGKLDKILSWSYPHYYLVICRYQEYKSEYISTQKRTYFEAHKDEEWY